MLKFYNILIISLLFFAFVVMPIIEISNKEVIIATVIEKERIVINRTSKYLIFTDKEVLQNSDYLYIGKFNSSDIYSTIKIGKTYKFTTIGKRIPILSSYKNIIKVEKIKD